MLEEEDQLPMKKHARNLWNTPCARPGGGGVDAPHQPERLPWLAQAPTHQQATLAGQEEWHMHALYHQVKEPSWLAQQLQQGLAGWTTTDFPFLHQCVMEQLATTMAKRAEQLQQTVRRDLERQASRAQNGNLPAERRAVVRDAKQNDGGEHEPDDALAFYHQAEGARRAGLYALALHGYDQTIMRAPSFTLAHHGLAACYLVSRQYRRALADYGWILACDPHDVLASYQRGEVYHQCRQDERALADYGHALALEPEYVPALLARAEVHLLLKQKARATSNFAQAARCEPDNGYAAWMAVFTSFDRGRPGDAIIAHLETLATRYASAEEGALCRGVALGLRGRWHAALIVLEQPLAQEPSSVADGYFWHGMFLVHIGTQMAAQVALEQACGAVCLQCCLCHSTDSNKNSPRSIRRWRCHCFSRQGQHEPSGSRGNTRGAATKCNAYRHFGSSTFLLRVSPIIAHFSPI